MKKYHDISRCDLCKYSVDEICMLDPNGRALPNSNGCYRMERIETPYDLEYTEFELLNKRNSSEVGVKGLQ